MKSAKFYARRAAYYGLTGASVVAATAPFTVFYVVAAPHLVASLTKKACEKAMVVSIEVAKDTSEKIIRFRDRFDDSKTEYYHENGRPGQGEILG